MIMAQLGSLLRKKRMKKKLSIRQLGKLTNVSPAYISQIENNYRKNPTPRVLRELCQGIGINYNDFLLELNELSDVQINERYTYDNDYIIADQRNSHETNLIDHKYDLYDLLEGDINLSYKGNVLDENCKDKIKQILAILLD